MVYTNIFIPIILSLFDMVRRIFIALDDDDFAKLESLKGKRTWEEFLVKPHLKEEGE